MTASASAVFEYVIHLLKILCKAWRGRLASAPVKVKVLKVIFVMLAKRPACSDATSCILMSQCHIQHFAKNHSVIYSADKFDRQIDVDTSAACGKLRTQVQAKMKSSSHSEPATKQAWFSYDTQQHGPKGTSTPMDAIRVVMISGMSSDP